MDGWMDGWRQAGRQASSGEENPTGRLTVNQRYRGRYLSP